MKLYYSPLACSLADHIALREAGFAFDLERVDLKTHRTGTGRDFRAAYIDGKPVMEDFRVIGADHEALAARAQRQFAKAIESHARQAGRPGEAGQLLSPSFPVILPPR